MHRSRDLLPEDIRIVNGLPTTTAARTVLDLTERHTPRQVERAYDEAIALRITSHTKARELLLRTPGHHGGPLLRHLADPNRPTSRTVSDGEEQLLRAIRQIPEIEAPECNVMIGDWEWDFYFRRAATVIEFQSYTWHNSKFSFTKDHRKRKELNRRGIEVIYVIDDDLEHDLLATLGNLVATLTRRTIERALARGQALDG